MYYTIEQCMHLVNAWARRRRSFSFWTAVGIKLLNCRGSCKILSLASCSDVSKFCFWCVDGILLSCILSCSSNHWMPGIFGADFQDIIGFHFLCIMFGWYQLSALLDFTILGQDLNNCTGSSIASVSEMERGECSTCNFRFPNHALL